MNRQIRQLAELNRNPARSILGLMSGTSCDGLDMALCSISGSGRSTRLQVTGFITCRYSASVRDRLLALGTGDEAAETLCLEHAWLGEYMARRINEHREQLGTPDLIASHGHTVWHAPVRLHGRQDYPNATLQIGEADRIAVQTGVPVISDFRQKDIARGGEGAPLAAYGDYLLFSDPGEDRILLNLGGIANITVLPCDDQRFPPRALDTGPGNTLIDSAVSRLYPDRDMDAEGRIARSGKVDQALLTSWKQHDYFRPAEGKTTGREVFGDQFLEPGLNAVEQGWLPARDLIATLTQLTADTAAGAILAHIARPEQTRVLVSGGGVHNPALMDKLTGALSGTTVESVAAIGMDPDAKEAALFALLANEALCGEAGEQSLGKLSLP